MRELFGNKSLIYAVSGLIVFFVLAGIGIQTLASSKKELKLLQERRKELLLLKDDYMSLKQKVDLVEAKKSMMNVPGIVRAIDEIFQPMGLKNKLKTVRAAGKKEIRDGFEEEAEITVEKVGMNEMLNIFYKIETAPMILTIKKASIKKSFENPELLNAQYRPFISENEVRKKLPIIILAAIPVLFWMMWIVFPETAIQTIIEDSVAGSQFVVEVQGLKKGLFYTVDIDALVLKGNRGELISVKNIRGHINPLFVPLFQLRLTGNGAIGDGNITGNLTLSRGKIEGSTEFSEGRFRRFAFFKTDRNKG